MVTDRCTTSCLITILAYFYRDWILFFLPVIALDITSHYAHLYSSLIRGIKSHKTISTDQNPLLKIYYSNRSVLGALCFGNEAFWLGLYLCYWTSGPILIGQLGLFNILTILVSPLMAIKQLMNLIQLLQASKDIVAFDCIERASKAD
eukprot:TRINITY_DN3022_c0_g1_i1.p1 TRINITY_DN3022_c0_g1~~TRINITY_DN3022_c0_g1_i1.p1  ORF type:complete len:148 (-),score=5.77 TRINITY_DN3022_c0_g1_i1:113-556(-)